MPATFTRRRGHCPVCARSVILLLSRADRVTLVIGPHLATGQQCPGGGQEPVPCSAL